MKNKLIVLLPLLVLGNISCTNGNNISSNNSIDTYSVYSNQTTSFVSEETFNSTFSSNISNSESINSNIILEENATFYWMLEDYENIDFRDIEEGEIKERNEIHIDRVKVKNDREAQDGEIKIPIYIYNNDFLEEAKYQYFILNQDYRGYPYSYNYIDITLEGDDLLTGLGNSPYIIGYYEDSAFTKLIDPEKLKSIDSSLEEIHVRRVEEWTVTNVLYVGSYFNEDVIVKATEDVFEISYGGNNYKVVGKGTYGGYRVKEIYINDIKVEDISKYLFSFSIISNSTQHTLKITLDYSNGDELISLLPYPSRLVKVTNYSDIAYLI